VERCWCSSPEPAAVAALTHESDRLTVQPRNKFEQSVATTSSSR
jgi:hypothetical protein